MARPIKNSCDYFSHDAGMRNHRKIKSVRQKFGITGYGIWCMLIEYLTASDGNEFENSALEYELMSGDFGVSVTEIRDVVDYCICLELLFKNNGFVFSESLNERLTSVYQKRGRAKELSKKQRRKNGQFVSSNTDSTAVSVTETPQSKVNEIKEKESSIITELSEIEVEIKISEMIVPEMIKVWKNKNPKYFSHAETDNHAVLQIAYNIATVKKWKKVDILKEKEKECIASFSKIVDYIMADNFWSKSTLETISKPANWQKILNSMVERTSQPIATIGQPETPRYNIYEQVKKYG